MSVRSFIVSSTNGAGGVALVLLLNCNCLGYDLQAVKGMEAFKGSDEARELLQKNGFVVADPALKQIFEAYIKSPQTEAPSETSPRGSVLPSFITVDSAWDTYHVLLEEGVKQMEEIQAKRLHNFSRQLLTAAERVNADPNLRMFSTVGLGLQDEGYRQTLDGEAKRIVDGLRTGSAPVAMPLGFELAPAQFRAQSFYTQSPELSDYFAARQWYASVVFRLADEKETALAIALSKMVSGNPELLKLWRQLSDPYDDFLARAEDGTVPAYVEAAKGVAGTVEPSSVLTHSQLSEIKKALEKRLPWPQVNDQLLSPEQDQEFGAQTRGFRLLPPRCLPCAVCFQNTVDPRIRGRTYPSGLDFMAASPVLRSPAAMRAVQSQYGKVTSEQILKAECGPMPDSLHGEAMQLLASLQQPLPPRAPACMRNEAWSDLQLWTQLGAWAQQRHTWALHTKMTVMVSGIITPPKGIVAPYPDFFADLAKLSRRTADAFGKANQEQEFEVKAAAGRLLDLYEFSSQISHSRDEKEIEAASDKLEQLSEFENRYYEQHRTELESGGGSNAYNRMRQDLEAMARRCATNGPAADADTLALRMFFDSRQNISRLINDFAPVCERLATLANKLLNGDALSEDDAEWIEGYGVTLAGFHFYYGNSYEVPRDDFPIVTRVFSNPLSDSMLYAGLARPQAIYVVIPDGKSLQLYRGAVMTYREFVRPNSQLLDDESWRDLISKGQTPPAPPFTRSFHAETSVRELLKQLHAWGHSEDANLGDLEDILSQINARATEKDLPQLLELLAGSKEEAAGGIVDGLTDIIGNRAWESYQQQLVEMLSSPNEVMAGDAARILIARPASVDVTNLVSRFPQQGPHARRLYCAILSHVPQPTEPTRRLFLRALQDANAGVRWQAVTAIGQSDWNDEQSQSDLVKMLDDTNPFVGAVAANMLARLNATNAAPALFVKLKAELAATNLPVEVMEQEAGEISQDFRRGGNQAVNVLDPDNQELHLFVSAEVTANMKRMAATRQPPRSFNLPDHNYNLTVALIEALGELRYLPAEDELFNLRSSVNLLSEDYETAATAALARIAPDRLTDELMATAKDKQVDSYLREQAMVGLCNLSATNRMRELIPLLDDTTPIEYSRPLPGMEWRVCDRAAETIAMMLGWERTIPMFIRPEQRDKTMVRVREWAQQAK